MRPTLRIGTRETPIGGRFMDARTRTFLTFDVGFSSIGVVTGIVKLSYFKAASLRVESVEETLLFRSAIRGLDAAILGKSVSAS
jgi:hypothetical protein